MAQVLCTGTDRSVLEARKLFLTQAGHKVTTATSEFHVLDACVKGKFDVVVIGYAVVPQEKQRILRLARQYCAGAKVLELYSPAQGRCLPDADDWLETPVPTPADLPQRVTELASDPTDSRKIS